MNVNNIESNHMSYDDIKEWQIEKNSISLLNTKFYEIKALSSYSHSDTKKKKKEEKNCSGVARENCRGGHRDA